MSLFNFEEKIYYNGEYKTYNQVADILQETPEKIYFAVKYFGKKWYELGERKSVEDQLKPFTIKGQTPKNKNLYQV